MRRDRWPTMPAPLLRASTSSGSAIGPSPRVRNTSSKTGGEGRAEPGYQGGEGAELIAARSGPGRLGLVRLARGELAEVVASVPVTIRPGEPHGADRAETDGGRALQARLKRCGKDQVPGAAERQPRQHVRLGVGERRAEYLPGGPSPSLTRLRAEWTIRPSGVEAQAPTAVFPLRNASHAWRNASCHGLSRPAHSRATAARWPAGRRSIAPVSPAAGPPDQLSRLRARPAR